MIRWIQDYHGKDASMHLQRGNFTFRKQKHDRHGRIAIYLVLILIGLYIIRQRQTDAISPPFVPTPTATRSAISFVQEAEAYFSSGKISQAIETYKLATTADSTVPDYWIALARLQVYDNKPDQALVSADIAIALDVENSMAHAMRALSLDWLGEFNDATLAAVRAIQLDSKNALAHAYYAEILTDTSRFAQAGDEARLAISLNPNSMDVHRVYGQYLESVAAYEDAIIEYQTAATINPNIGLLYIRLGLNYRVLGDYDTAIQYFQMASALEPDNVGPYLSISRTYYQTGEYGRSTQYLESAMEMEPWNADIYGRLGLVEFKSLNYENATINLGCVVEGCTHPVTNTEIYGLPIGPLTLEYYYTYGSVLSAYLDCDHAMSIMRQVSAYASDDETVQGIVEENKTICGITN